MRKGQMKKNAGMTYVELIVVLSIFSVVSSVTMFNYRDFQARIDIKNLASDIALKIVEAQKSAISGLLPPPVQQASVVPGWKPSYGLYFATSANKSFVQFTDLNSNGSFDGADCTGECRAKISITKENFISAINVFYQGSLNSVSVPNVAVTFSRPDSGARISSIPSLGSNVSHIDIVAATPRGATALVRLYSSGRIEVR